MTNNKPIILIRLQIAQVVFISPKMIWNNNKKIPEKYKEEEYNGQASRCRQNDQQSQPPIC